MTVCAVPPAELVEEMNKLADEQLELLEINSEDADKVWKYVRECCHTAIVCTLCLYVHMVHMYVCTVQHVHQYEHQCL